MECHTYTTRQINYLRLQQFQPVTCKQTALPAKPDDHKGETELFSPGCYLP